MKNKRKVSELLQVSKKNILILFCIGIILTVGYSLVIYYDNVHIEEIKLSDYQLGNENALGAVDSITIQDNTTDVTGWFACKGVETNRVKMQIVLALPEENVGYIVNTELRPNIDTTSFINDGLNYDNSGFKAVFLNEKFQKGKDYNIYLLFQGEYQGIEFLIDMNNTFSY